MKVHHKKKTHKADKATSTMGGPDGDVKLQTLRMGKANKVKASTASASASTAPASTASASTASAATASASPASAAAASASTASASTASAATASASTASASTASTASTQTKTYSNPTEYGQACRQCWGCCGFAMRCVWCDEKYDPDRVNWLAGPDDIWDPSPM